MTAPHHGTTGTPPIARACWIESPGRAALRDAALAPVADGQVQVRALHSAVSRGTEMLVFAGCVPPSEHERMRAPFQEGMFPAPVKYGYASVGLVEQGPPALCGRSVFCLYPHQTRYVVPAGAVHLLPDGLPPARAVLAANMETAVNALWDASPRVGDRIAVVGGGVLGLLAGWLAARIAGCTVQLVDTQAGRADIAHRLGLDFALPDAAHPDADLVIHASGRPEGLATGLGLAGFEATVLDLSWYGDRPVNLPLGEAFHARRLRIQSSQVGHLAPAQRARWTHARRMALALRLLAGAPELDALVTDHAPFEQLPEVLQRLARGAPGTLCQRIDYS
ncbi:zinc-binding alcohol dehydrogenase [Variovorax sp.]|uniref:zinc-dependent alcohol dehydrogenase n=1 Tax=Variovorax sp. TaxID=1871043 RepID=UPI002D4CEC06|nr:zinc-binding alcohol dehydrogenase [Variovorax sp.]HYP85509.1 zinc-binding alcohol dehydrogenase [Variovorax sp.]